MAEKDKKGIFDKAIDKLTTRDEKEALEKTQSELEQAQSELEQAKKESSQAKAIVGQARAASAHAQEQAKKSVEDANKKTADAEAKIKELEAELRRQKGAEARRKEFERQQAMREKQTAAEAAPDSIAEHTVASEETLSHIALKYYGNASKPYYMAIYEANKDAIGDDPNLVRVGTKLVIPELPEELKEE